MRLISTPSPNFNDRPDEPVSILVLHYTGMKNPGDALDRLTKADSKVSAHYLVCESGKMYAMVPEEKRAWHAGVSHWRGRNNLNDISIGIEVENPGHEWGYRPFPKAQMEAVAGLCQDILSRHPIPPRNVIAHSDIAPERKEDPGELFDWQWLAEQGVGVWPQIPPPVYGGRSGGGLGQYGNEFSARKKATLAKAGRLRKNMTDAEKLLWSVLRMKQIEGARFRRQYSLGSYIADFACVESQLIIELDGGQHAEDVGYDAKRTAFMEKAGFRVLRFWNNEVMENLEGVYSAIVDALRAPLPLNRIAIQAPRKRVEGLSMPDISHIQQALQDYGYYLPVSGEMDALTQKTIIAFQRHFRPKKLEGRWDEECENLLQALLKY